MKFPVDLLADASQQQLEKLAHEYLNTLRYSNPDDPERLTLSDSTQVSINISSMGFTPLYGQSDKERILALFSPSDPMVAIALYLLDQWWTMEDILKTADPARRGVLPVDTLGERIVLYVLNRVIYRVKEMSSEEIPFLCHGEKDHAKILWDDGEAVGFYSVKAAGTLFNRYSSKAYQLPVMDSIFVRKGRRGKGSGLLMLEDFVLSSSEDSLGLKYPLSKSMYRVCEKYLRQHPEDADFLWEVEKTGSPHQRTNIASKLQVMDLSVVSKRLSFTEESHMIQVEPGRDVREDAISKGRTTTVEMMEETTVVRSTKGRRLTGSRQSTLGENTEDHSQINIRIERIVAGAPRELQGSVQQEMITLHRQTEVVFNHQEAGEDTSNATSVADEALSLNQSHRDLDEEPQDEIRQDEHVPVPVPVPASPAAAENVTTESEEDPAGLLLLEKVCELHTETLKQGDQGHVWRRTTLVSTTTVEGDTQHLQEAEEDPDEEDTLSTLDIVAGTDPDSRETAEMSEDVFVPGQLRQEERQQLEGEEQTEKNQEFGVMETVLEEISAEHPDTAEPAKPGGQPSTEGLELEEGHVSDDESEEPPVVQRRRPGDRRKVRPRSSKQRQHKEAGTHTHGAELEAGRSSGGKEAEDNQMEEQNQVEEDRTRDETSTTELLAVVEEDRAEESEEIVLTSPEGRTESTEVGTEETAPEKDPEEEDLAEDGGEERDGTTVADLHRPRVPEEPDLTMDCEITTLQRASVILVDLKTSSNHMSVMLASGASDLQRLVSEMEEVEPIAAERTNEKPEPESGEDGSGNERKEESSHLNPEEEKAPLMETTLLRSGRKIVKGGRQEHEGEDTAAVRTCEQDQDAETKEEKQALPNDGVPGEDPADEEESAEETSTQPEINEELRFEDEAPVHLQPSTQESEKKISGEDETEAENQTDAPPEVGGGPTQTPQSGEDDEAEGVSAEEEEPAAERRTLRSGRKTGHVRTPNRRSAAATSQRQSKGGHTHCESEERGAEEPKPDLEDVTEEELRTEEEVKGRDDRVAAAEKEEILQPRSEEDEETGRDGASIPARAPRKTRRSAAAPSRRKSKRSRMQSEPEEEPSVEDEDEEENKKDDGEIAGIENGDEDVDQEEEEPQAEGGEMDVGSETRPNGQEENSLRETSSVPNAVALGDTDEEEDAAVATQDLGSHGNGVKDAPGTKSPKHQMEESEETLLETSSPDTEEDVVLKAGEQESEAQEREEEELVEEETTGMETGMTNEKPEPESGEDGTEERNDAEEGSENERKEESSHLNPEEEEEEEAPLMETTLLRSGRKIVKGGRQEHEGEDTAEVRTCEQDQDAETKGEKQALPNDGVPGEDPADEEESAEETSTQPEINEELRFEDEAPVHLQPSTQESEKKISGEDEAEAENQTDAPPEVGGGPLPSAEDQENVNASTSPDTGLASNPEGTFGSEEKQEELDPPGSDLQRVMVVLVDLRNSSLPQDETGVAASVDEVEPAAEVEGEEESEAAADGPSDVPEEAVTTQTPQSGEDDEAEGVSAEEEEPAAERRILRSGRKTGHVRTPKRRSAAATSHQEREEEELVEEETTRMKTDGVGEDKLAESETMNDESAEGTPELDPGADGDGTRTGMDEETTETGTEPPSAAPEEDHRAEDEAGLSKVPAAHEPSGLTGAKELEASDADENVESDLVTMETKQVIDLELNTDEDEDESNSGEEEDLSDANGEPIVIRKKVLRGRTVPAVTITPHQPARRKRKWPHASPARTPRRRSRV